MWMSGIWTLPLLFHAFLLIADIPKNDTICLADSSLQFWQATICSVSNLLPILFFSYVFGKEIFNLYFREWNLEHPGFHYIVCCHDDYKGIGDAGSTADFRML